MPRKDVPAALDAGGRALWKSLLAQDAALAELDDPRRDVALEACRTKDRLDQLDAICRAQPVMLDNGKGQPVAHPAWVEARQQAALLARLQAALRLPDEATGKRPQHRQVRGVQRPSSAKDRLRAV